MFWSATHCNASENYFCDLTATRDVFNNGIDFRYVADIEEQRAVWSRWLCQLKKRFYVPLNNYKGIEKQG